MFDGFTLEVPADAPFSAFAPEVAGRYIEIIGGTDTDRAACEARLAAAVEELNPQPGTSITIRVSPGPAGLEISAACAGRSRIITQPLPTKAT